MGLIENPTEAPITPAAEAEEDNATTPTAQESAVEEALEVEEIYQQYATSDNEPSAFQ